MNREEVYHTVLPHDTRRSFTTRGGQGFELILEISMLETTNLGMYVPYLPTRLSVLET